MPVAPSSGKVSVSKIKANLLRPALTSHFRCSFIPPESVRNFLVPRGNSGVGRKSISFNTSQELIELSCSDASLPGSSLSTHEVNNDYTGVTERYAYRRLYDDKADFTFYVDRDYTIIYFFENWISYVVGEDDIGAQRSKRNYSYRMNYPKNYIADLLSISKFERDFDMGQEEAKGILSNPSNKSGGSSLTYQFINAYPTSIASMPVSYESSQLLKCTVSFSYSRYVIGFQESEEKQKKEPAAPQTANGNPDIPTRPSPETIPNYSGIFNEDDPTRIFQRYNLGNTNSTAFGNPRLS